MKRLKVVMVHHTLSSLGGAERVFTYACKALNELGIKPLVYASSPATPEELERFYGVRVEYSLARDSLGFLKRPKIPLLSIYQRLLTGLLSSSIEADVVLNTTGVLTFTRFSKDAGRYLLYIYNPLVDSGGRFLAGGGGLEKYDGSLFWRMYFAPFKKGIALFVKSLIKKVREGKVKLLAVSGFTAARIRLWWGVNSSVVYPPVDVDKFSKALELSGERDSVVMLGRFSPEKRWMEAVEVARRLRNVRFVFIGAANTPYYRHYYLTVKSRVESLNLRNVELRPNLPFNELIKELSHARIVMHLLRNEDFGLAPAEAASAGALPIVHDSGGLREVVPYRELRFRDLNELTARIRHWLSVSKEEAEEKAFKVRTHVRRNFSSRKFIESIKKHVMQALSEVRGG